MRVKASELVGNSFKLKKDVRAFRGRPNSNSYVTWNKGRLTDPVYSWVQEPDGLWWMFGRNQPVYFIKHDSDALEPFAETGAAQFLDADLGGTKGAARPLINAGFNLPNVGGMLKAAAGVLIFVITLQLISFFK